MYFFVTITKNDFLDFFQRSPLTERAFLQLQVRTVVRQTYEIARSLSSSRKASGFCTRCLEKFQAADCRSLFCFRT